MQSLNLIKKANASTKISVSGLCLSILMTLSIIVLETKKPNLLTSPIYLECENLNYNEKNNFKCFPKQINSFKSHFNFLKDDNFKNISKSIN